MSALGKTALSAESRRRRLAIVLGSSLLIFASIVLTQPIPQDPAYHNFADQRHLLGIPHMWNAVSNLPFAVTGAWGCWWLFGARGRSKAFAEPWERTACFVFFLGEFLTCFGSGYYHADPNNQPHLAYSKLPSTCLLATLGLHPRAHQPGGRRVVHPSMITSPSADPLQK